MSDDTTLMAEHVSRRSVIKGAVTSGLTLLGLSATGGSAAADDDDDPDDPDDDDDADDPDDDDG